jgi:molecular chaperone GrpE
MTEAVLNEENNSVEEDNEVSTLKDQLLRALAEQENIRKRSQREVEEANKYAISSFARELLSVSDNLKRALDVAPENDDEKTKTFIQGIEMTEKELLNSFAKFGIKKISPEGEKFDHNHHQAMFEAPDEAKEPGTVIQVLQPGYILHDRLLRPALVGVSKKA